MYIQQNTNVANIERNLWKNSTTPRMSIVKQLLSKLQAELETVNETEQIKFGEDFSLYEQIKSFEIDMIRHALYLTNNHNAQCGANWPQCCRLLTALGYTPRDSAVSKPKPPYLAVYWVQHLACKRHHCEFFYPLCSD